MGNLSEQEIRDLFQKRELTPDNKSWEKLENMMGDHRNKKYFVLKRGWSVAASFLILGVLSWIWLNNEHHTLPYTVEKQEIAAASEAAAEKVISEPEGDSHTTATANVETNETNSLDKLKTKHNNTVSSKAAHREHGTHHDAEFVSDATLPENTSYDQAIVTNEADISAQNSTMHQKETDSLLLLVQGKLKEERVQAIKARYQLNPDKLLAEAEKKSEETLFKKLVKNVQSTSGQVLTAVVNRNYEK
jgi:hypothetical protein